jgi:hypothetical protein
MRAHTRGVTKIYRVIILREIVRAIKLRVQYIYRQMYGWQLKAKLRRIWKEAVVGRIVGLPLNLRKGTLKTAINFSEDNHVPAEILSSHIRNTTSDRYRYTIPLSTKYFLYFFPYELCIAIVM